MASPTRMAMSCFLLADLLSLEGPPWVLVLLYLQPNPPVSAVPATVHPPAPLCLPPSLLPLLPFGGEVALWIPPPQGLVSWSPSWPQVRAQSTAAPRVLLPQDTIRVVVQGWLPQGGSASVLLSSAAERLMGADLVFSLAQQWCNRQLPAVADPLWGLLAPPIYVVFFLDAAAHRGGKPEILLEWTRHVSICNLDLNTQLESGNNLCMPLTPQLCWNLETDETRHDPC